MLVTLIKMFYKDYSIIKSILRSSLGHTNLFLDRVGGERDQARQKKKKIIKNHKNKFNILFSF